MNKKKRGPALSLDELSTAWLERRITQLKSMPGINNTIGSVQMEADILAFKHPGEPVVCVELTVKNTTVTDKTLDIGFLLSGRARNTGKEGYAWAVPTVPTGVSSFNSIEGLYQSIEYPDVPGTALFINDRNNAFTAQSFSPRADEWERGQVPRFRKTVPPGGEHRLSFLAAYHTSRQRVLQLLREWKGKEEKLFSMAREWWEDLWESAGDHRRDRRICTGQSDHGNMVS